MLLSEIVTTDPDSMGYASMTDAQIEDDIKNAKRHSIRVRVSFSVFMQTLIDHGILMLILQAYLDPTHLHHSTAVMIKTFLDTARENGIQSIDMDKPGNDLMFDSMQTASFMNAEQRVILEALADSPASLAEVHELTPFSHLDIAKITGGTN